MQFSKMTVAAALASVATATYGTNTTASPVYVTDIVTEYTTYCPAATTFSAYGSTYTITEATTLTLPCPCTSIYVSTPTAAPVTSKPVYQNTTVPAVPSTVVPITTGSPVTSTPPAGFTGAANKIAGSAAGLGGVLAMAAYFL